MIAVSWVSRRSNKNLLDVMTHTRIIVGEMRHGLMMTLHVIVILVIQSFIPRKPMSDNPMPYEVTIAPNAVNAVCIADLKATSNDAKIFARQFHKLAVNGGWWHDMKNGEPLDRNKGELLCLIHSEISETMEAERKNLMDSHLPDRKAAEVELADAVIRIFDYADAYGYDVIGAMVEKAQYNTVRADHKIENRVTDHGKKF